MRFNMVARFAFLLVVLSYQTGYSRSIYMSMQGVDCSSADSACISSLISSPATKPVRTLAGAHVIACALWADPATREDTNIYVSSGTYVNQGGIIWSCYSPTYKTIIQPALNAAPNSVIFDGRTQTDIAALRDYSRATYSYFVNFKVPVGTPQDAVVNANLTMRGIQINHYFQAVNLFGSYFKSGTTYAVKIRNITLSDNTFEKIGNKWAVQMNSGTPSPAMAAVGLSNCDDSSVLNNKFINIENTSYIGEVPNQGDSQYIASGLHGLYVAYRSKNNRIEGNSFYRMRSSTVVKFRDRSNGNKVFRNQFDIVRRAIQIDHCELLLNEPCTVPFTSARFQDTDVDSQGIFEKYEDPSTSVQERQNLYQRMEDGVSLFQNSSNQNVSPFYIPTFVQVKSRPNVFYIDAAAILFQKDSSVTNSGNIVESTYPSGAKFYGRCSTPSACANNNNYCFSVNTGSSTMTCDSNNDWSECGAANVGRLSNNGARVCRLLNGSYVWENR